MKTQDYITKIRNLKSQINSRDSNDIASELDYLINSRPDRVGAYLLKVDQALRNKNLMQAIAILENGIDKCTDNRLRLQLAILRCLNKDYNQAIKICEALYKSGVKDTELLFTYANALKGVNRLKEAKLLYEECLLKNEKHLGALNNLANLYFQIEDLEHAGKLYLKASSLSPNDPLVWLNIGNTLVKQKAYEKAISSFKKSIKISPVNSKAYYNLGQVYVNILGQKEEALRWYEEGIRNCEGELKTVLEILTITLKWQLADWQAYDEELPLLHNLLTDYLNTNSEFTLVPYELSYCSVDPLLYKKVSIRYAKNLESKAQLSLNYRAYNHTVNNKKIKIGYYSGEFRKHPGGLLVRRLFEFHDRSQFEIHAISLSESSDLVTEDIKESVDYFHDVSNQSVVEIADLINRLGIDILVVLAGYNTSMKFDALAFKPAPIQIMAVGCHQTSGADFIDYVFSDTVMISDEIKTHFTECIITLPCSTLFNCALPDTLSKPTKRADFDLPDDKFIYASFNHSRKLVPETLSVWVEILNGAKDSILWLYTGDNLLIQQRINSFFENIGLSNRVVFAKEVELSLHWERFKHADLLLDTLIYNGHFTTIEALRNGLPVLTIKGSNHNARLGSSLLHFAGLDEYIARNEKEYISKAIELSFDQNIIHKAKKKLQDKDTLIFDSWRQVKYLEKAYKGVLSNYKNGKHKSIKIDPSLPFDVK